MTKHSRAGYLALVEEMRRERTVLVEGTTDSTVYAQLLHVEPIIGLTRIDSADSIKADGRGNRALVVDIINSATNPTKFAGIVDREYTDFVLSDLELRDERRHPFIAKQNLFETTGHSSENHILSDIRVGDTLRSIWADKLPPELITECVVRYPAILRELVRLTLPLKNEQLLSKCNGLLQLDSWIADESTIALSLDNVVTKLRSRNVEESAIAAIRRGHERLSSSTAAAPVQLLERLVHGHFALSGVFSGCGAILNRRGVENAICDAVASGHQDERRRWLARHWATDARKGVADVPAGFMRWLLRTG